MKRFIQTAMALVLVLLPGALMATGDNDNGLGQSAGYDLDALWAQAQSHYDLEEEDAILLLESKQVTFTQTGDITTRVHRVAWVGTSVGIRGYADLRIPWNTASSTLEVEILRTWREGRWWPDEEKISDTAVVHTLPHALDRADDYTTMRETMLLHDGVELGCIMETAYSITERNVPARGGIFILPRNDPAVLTELKVIAPSTLDIRHEELNGVAAPTVLDESNLTTRLWKRENTNALKRPVTSSPEAYEPAVVWSSWENWGKLADHWLASINDAATIDPGLVESLHERLYPTMSQWEKIAVVGDYLNEMVRRVHYDDRFWRFVPRSAAQTMSTAYGHDLDRAVLAMALLKETGFNVEPKFVGEGVFLASPEIPRLQDMGRILVRVPQIMEGYLNPATGKVVGPDEAYGHPFLDIASMYLSEPHPRHLPHGEIGFKVAISLEPGSDGVWMGSGNFRGATVLSPFSQVVADDDLRSGFLAKLVGSVISGVEVTGANPIRIDPDLVEIGFDIKISESDDDAAETMKFQVGAPAGGISSKLPGDVHLYEPTRSTPVMGLEGLVQVVTVRIMVDPEDVLHRPEPKSIQNKAGSFELEVLEEDGWLTLIRTVTLARQNAFPPGDWPDLRALLLEETDPVNGTIWLK